MQNKKIKNNNCGLGKRSSCHPHKLEITGSNPVPATKNKGSDQAKAVHVNHNTFVYDSLLGANFRRCHISGVYNIVAVIIEIPNRGACS